VETTGNGSNVCQEIDGRERPGPRSASAQSVYPGTPGSTGSIQSSWTPTTTVAASDETRSDRQEAPRRARVWGVRTRARRRGDCRASVETRSHGRQR